MKIERFGAFCSLSGTSRQGLVHISQLGAGRRVEEVEDVVKPGDQVWVKVLGVKEEGHKVRIDLGMRGLDQSDGSELPEERRSGSWRGGGGGDELPELYSIHHGTVERMATRKGEEDSVFGAFVALPGFRKQGLLHVSQLANERVEAADIGSYIHPNKQVYVKVIDIDEEAGKLSLSMKYAAQRNGRDLDPTHAECQDDANRRIERRGVDGPARGGRDNLASLQVPEYGGKQHSGGEYAMLSDEEDVGPPASAQGATYQLQLGGGLNPGSGAGGVDAVPHTDKAKMVQVELVARLKQKEAPKKTKESKMHKNEKKSKKEKKEKKNEKKVKKEKKAKKAKKEKKEKKKSDKKAKKGH